MQLVTCWVSSHAINLIAAKRVCQRGVLQPSFVCEAPIGGAEQLVPPPLLAPSYTAVQAVKNSPLQSDLSKHAWRHI